MAQAVVAAEDRTSALRLRPTISNAGFPRSMSRDTCQPRMANARDGPDDTRNAIAPCGRSTIGSSACCHRNQESETNRSVSAVPTCVRYCVGDEREIAPTHDRESPSGANPVARAGPSEREPAASAQPPLTSIARRIRLPGSAVRPASHTPRPLAISTNAAGAVFAARLRSPSPPDASNARGKRGHHAPIA